MFDSLLPKDEGWLPKWLLLVGGMALFNTVQNFLTLSFTRRLYNVQPHLVNNLQARTFAVWTLTSAIVRIYAAYHTRDKTIYDIAFFTYLLAFGHFGSEIFIFRTGKITGPMINPVIVSTVSLVWMFVQYDHYVKGI